MKAEVSFILTSLSQIVYSSRYRERFPQTCSKLRYSPTQLIRGIITAVDHCEIGWETRGTDAPCDHDSLRQPTRMAAADKSLKEDLSCSPHPSYQPAYFSL